MATKTCCISGSGRITGTTLIKIWNSRIPLTPKDASLDFNSLAEKDRIIPQEIEEWKNNLPGKLPFTVHWDQAEQKIINGKHVIAVPLTNEAALFFTKEKSVLKAYAYRWNKKDTETIFTGAIQVFSFQSYGYIAMVYKNGNLNKTGFSPEVAGVATVQNALKEKKLNSTLQTNTLTTNSLAKFLAHTACTLIGGTWVDENWETGVGPACQDWFSYSWHTAGSGTSGSDNSGDYGSSVYGVPAAYFSPAGGDPGSGPTGAGGGDSGGIQGNDGSYFVTSIAGDGSVWVNVWAVPDQSGCPTPGLTAAKDGFSTNTFNPHDCDGVAHWQHYKLPEADQLAAKDQIFLIPCSFLFAGIIHRFADNEDQINRQFHQPKNNI